MKTIKKILPVLVLTALVLSACNSGMAASEPTAVPTTAAMPTTGVPETGEQVTPTAPAAATTPAPVETSTQPVETVQPTAVAPAEAAPTDMPIATGGAQLEVPSDTVTAFPDPAAFAWQPVATGLVNPLDLVYPPDGTDRLFVLEQPGVIRVIENGSLLPEPFLDIQDRVGSSGNEQGLLGMDFHPNYAENGFFYINYTDRNGDTVIARYNAVSGSPNQADPGSESVLLRVDQPYPNHNGGGMLFGPDGYLYMSLGDGGSGGDPRGNAQSLNTLLGKILRVDVNSGEPYAIPQDNPYANGGGEPEIWAYGLRNPWRFSFDRLTGDLYIADVGQNQWEEIDFYAAGDPAGANFGWDFREGSNPFEGQPPAGLELIDPVYEYTHAEGCSVTGGYVYRGQDLPEFRGVYIFSDFCSGRVWGLLRGADGSWQSQELYQTGMNVTSFGEDSRGEIYLIDQDSGVYRLQRQ